MKTVISWNVNGVRAAARKGLVEWLMQSQPDVLCLQETKAHPEQLEDSVRQIPGYSSHWMSAQRRGYSGVAVYAKEMPEQVSALGAKEFDSEGRTLVADFADFTVIGAYFPNSQPEGIRLSYKLEYCQAIQELCSNLRDRGRHFVLCGDYNIAHKPIDLANPKENEGNPGYLPEERGWMDTFTGAGFVDTFREFDLGPGNYTWWSYRMNAREKNIGWRLDYHCVPAHTLERVRSSTIHPEVVGSDHCPVSVSLDI